MAPAHRYLDFGPSADRRIAGTPSVHSDASSVSPQLVAFMESTTHRMETMMRQLEDRSLAEIALLPDPVTIHPDALAFTGQVRVEGVLRLSDKWPKSLMRPCTEDFTEFRRYLRATRALADSTIESNVKLMGQFLNLFNYPPGCLEQLAHTWNSMRRHNPSTTPRGFHSSSIQVARTLA